MTLTPYAESCECCRDALAGKNFGRFDMACMGCRGRDLGRHPLIDAARAQARMLKAQLLATDFEAMIAAREAWIDRDKAHREGHSPQEGNHANEARAVPPAAP